MAHVESLDESGWVATCLICVHYSQSWIHLLFQVVVVFVLCISKIIYIFFNDLLYLIQLLHIAGYHLGEGRYDHCSAGLDLGFQLNLVAAGCTLP